MTEPAPPKPRRRNWKAIAWKATVIMTFLPAYMMIISEGLRSSVPAFGQRLHKLPFPGLSLLGRFEETYRLDLAHLFSVCMLLSVCFLWREAVRMTVAPGTLAEDSDEWSETVYARYVITLGCTILVADSILFFIGIGHQSAGLFGADRISVFSELLTTIVYVSTLLLVALVTFRVDFKKPK